MSCPGISWCKQVFEVEFAVEGLPALDLVFVAVIDFVSVFVNQVLRGSFMIMTLIELMHFFALKSLLKAYTLERRGFSGPKKSLFMSFIYTLSVVPPSPTFCFVMPQVLFQINVTRPIQSMHGKSSTRNTGIQNRNIIWGRIIIETSCNYFMAGIDRFKGMFSKHVSEEEGAVFKRWKFRWNILLKPHKLFSREFLNLEKAIISLLY